MNRKEVKVHHWGYHNGWRSIPEILRKNPYTKQEFDADLMGWHCWVFTDDWDKFERWLKDNMKGDFECTRRFNSGDPMLTLIIRDDEDATVFKLTWL